MDSRYLDSFLQVARLGSTAAAARALNLTPTAVAQRIRALEEEIGAPLLSRAGRTMQLTASGAALVEPASSLMKQMEALKAIAALDVITGELRIGCITTALAYLVPQVLADLISRYAYLRPHVEPLFSTEQYRKIQADEIDVALMVRPTFELPKEFKWRSVGHEPFVVLAPQGMRHRDPHALLRDEPLVRYHRRSWGGMLADRYLQDNGITPIELMEIDALDAIAAMVRGGLGVSLVPQWRPLHVHLDELAQIPLPAPGVFRPIGLLWKRNSPKTRLIQVLHDTLAQRISLPAEGDAS